MKDDEQLKLNSKNLAKGFENTERVRALYNKE